MMVPELKSFDCFDHDPIDQWVPESEEEVNYSLCLHIGPADEEGADLFYVDVLTPQSINEHNLGRSSSCRRIVVNPYSWDVVLDAVREILESCSGKDWSEQSEKLAVHFNWEFEGYRPSES